MERRAEAIGSQLRCLVCQNQSLEDSDADLARDLRRIVRQRVVAGDSDQQVMAWMEARYGDFVRLRPPFRPLTWALWFSPVLFLGVGAAAVLLSRRRNIVTPTPLDAGERARLDSLLQEP
jgi:cytochrome c-type biogenesis protein CcmH